MSVNLETCIEPHLRSFEQSYAAENYTARTIATYRCLTRKFGELLDEAGITPSAVTFECVERLTRDLPRGARNRIRLDTLARRLAQHLIDIGVAQPVPLTEAEIARAALLADFEMYLVKQRGLSPRSVSHSLGFARRFLDHRFGEAMPDPGHLRPADAFGFMEHVLASARRDKTVANHVRIFLQYLFGCGATATNLALSVPKMANRWGARLPRHLSPDGIEAVLAFVRGNQRHGTRDYAMLLLMARLGLRAAEVIAIQLDDIDWRAGELLVRGKGKLHDRLPITVEVGDALSCYLREERGPATCRTLFVTHRAPNHPFKNGQIVNTILKDALKATGQKPVTPYVGSHLLRHSLATQLVNTGASLDEIGHVLRHRTRSSTMIYARLDLEGLRSIAQPWPVAGGAL
ncbi:integrase [Pseudomonas sp. Fig-3]|uniref:tyrosine-type recombinase/integrase n=1 Tax=unclassified Pseudomonas TaxID=196821 RepID=UPI001111AF67|nr:MULTISPECIES: tyrosine-type recombinase/integrase [unclassified Pseudomonas]TNB81540.1 integrase [Pseudomonas sp. Fig-3]